MKKIIAILITIVLVSSGNSKVFAIVSGIKMNDIQIEKKGITEFIKIGCFKKDMIRIFGQPSKIEIYNFETDNKKGLKLSYQNNYFYFIDDKLIGFEFKSELFSVFINSKTKVMIGNAIKTWPQGFTIRKHAICYDLKNAGNTTTDQFIEFDRNSSDEVTKVIYGDY